MPKRILILAGNYRQAEQWAAENGLAPADWSAAAGPESFRGHSPDTARLVVTGEFWGRPDIYLIRGALAASGFPWPPEAA